MHRITYILGAVVCAGSLVFAARFGLPALRRAEAKEHANVGNQGLGSKTEGLVEIPICDSAGYSPVVQAPAVNGRSSAHRPQPRRLTVNASSYCPCAKCCGKWADGRTASGIPAIGKIIAVDPRVIPMHSRVYVPGYGLARAEDTGSAIKGNKIDLLFTDDPGKPGSGHKKALNFGRKTLTVTVWSKP